MKQKFIIIASLFVLAFAAAPDAFSQWVQTNGPYGGHVACLAVSGTNLFAGTNGRVYHSSDSGASWVGSIGAKMYTYALAASGSNLFAETYDGFSRSTDNGISWTTPSTSFKSANVLAISGTNLLAGTGLGMFRSIDSGTSWTSISKGLPQNADIRALLVNGAYLFAGTCGSGVFRSSDGGTSWTESNIGMVNACVQVLTVIGGTLFAGTYNNGVANAGVFRSTDDGASWFVVANPGLVNAFAVNGTHLFAATNHHVFRSSDEGISWTSVSKGLPQMDTNINALAVIGTNLFACSDYKGVFRSTDNGASWIAVNAGLINIYAYTFALSGSNLFAGTDDPYHNANWSGSVFRTTDDGTSWVEADSGLTGAFLYTLCANSANIYAGTGYGVFRSSDNGATWITANAGFGVEDWDVNGGLAENGTNLVAATATGTVFFSSNGGVSWKALNTGSPLYYADVIAIMDTSIFVGSAQGFGGHGVYRLTDNGANWTEVQNGLPMYLNGFQQVWWYLNVKSLAIIDSDLFAGTYLSDYFEGKGVYRSSDAGANWIGVNTGLTNGNVSAIAVRNSNLFAGTDGGVFLSSNYGSNWMNVSTGLTDTIIYALGITNKYIFAGTSHSGVWRRPLSDFGINTADNKLPEQPIRNYPNPFTEKTAITFSTAAAGFASVSVLDLLGAEVARIYSGELQAGEHSLSWDAQLMPAGMYIAIVKTGGEVREIPVMLAR